MERAPAEGKKLYIAAIKIFAIFLVAFNHTDEYGYLLFTVSNGSPFFPVYMFLSAFCKVAVPLFFMCSGALLLGKDESIGRLYVHRILRYAAALVLFSIVSYAHDLYFHSWSFDFSYFLYRLYAVHLARSYWFLYSYLGYLIILPFLRKMARGMGDREMLYLFALQLAVAGVVRTAESMFGDGTVRTAITLQLLSQNIVFPLLGYWIDKRLDVRKLNRKHIAWGAAITFLTLLAMCGLTVAKAQLFNGGKYADSAFFSSFTCIPTVATFILMKYLAGRVRIGQAAARFIQYASGLVFGVYLIHLILMDELQWLLKLLVPVIHSFPAAIVWAAAAVVLSGVVTAALKRVPLLSKLL
jgi:surface polysaccharide O-acyltransferase-like enzyme